MRLFVAMDIPEAVRQALEEFVRPLAAIRSGARWVRIEGLHVTLKFIGETSAERAKHIQQALAGVRSPSPVRLHIHGTGFFPNAKHPRVFWAGIDASANLAELAVEIEHRLASLGIPREKRPFKPHLTLARFKDERGLEDLREALARMGNVDFGQFECREFYLYESRLKPDGAEYTKLRTFVFLEAGQ